MSGPKKERGRRKLHNEEFYIVCSFPNIANIRVIKIICDNSGGHVSQRGKVHRGLKPTGRLRK